MSASSRTDALAAIAFVTFVSCEGDTTRMQFSSASLTRAQAAAMQIDEAQLETDVEALHQAHQSDVPDMPTWGHGMTHTHHLSAAYVRDRFAALGFTPVVEHSDDDGLDVDNVYVEIRGERAPNDIVIVSAHHDAWWQSGADDNASGVAVVLEGARILRDSHPARTIRFIAFDREEEGLIGANRYAAAHASDHVTMILNMDCVGFASDEPNSQRAPLGLGLRSVGNFLLAAADERAADALSQIVRFSATSEQLAPLVGLVAPDDAHYPVDSSFLRSDHAPFWRAGVPGVFLTDTANFRNAHYHTPTDLPATVNYAFLARVARLVVGATAAFAEVD
jgi:hypothetical protein